jgi:hypothetical protein
MGIVTFLISSGIFIALEFHSTWRELSLISTIGVAWVWEIIENSILREYKFRKRQDGLFNSLLDIFFCTVGGIMQMVISFMSNFITYLFISIEIMIVISVIYILWRQKVLRGEKTEMSQLVKRRIKKFLIKENTAEQEIIRE